MNPRPWRDTVASMLRAGALVLAAAFVCAAPATGAYPGRNGRVAYVESALGRTGVGWGPTIVSVRLDGTSRQTLTTATRTSGDFEPAWAPDGRRLSYVHSTGSRLGTGTAGTEIWLMNADGTRKRRLTRNALSDGSPTWSPDGRSILFVRGRLFVGRDERPSSDLWVMDADGTHQRRITHTPELELDPAWSPRGDRIAFLVAPLTRSCNASRCTVGRERELWTSAPDGMRRAGGGLGGDLIPSAPSWSPDGSRLAAGTRLGLISVAADGTDPRLLGGGDDPAWSPDGTLLVVTDQFGVANFLGLQLVTVGGRSSPLTRNPAPSAELLIDQTQPDWQPVR
jgi:Tol biopolymer transport system component